METAIRIRPPTRNGERAAPAVAIDGGDGVVLIRDANTTIGYCRYTPAGDIEYIFVNPAHRRRGYGRRLLAEVERRTGRRGAPLAPISPLGRRLFGLDAAPAGIASARPNPAYTEDTMKAFLIDPAARAIVPVELAPGLDAVREAIGFPTVDSDEIDDNGDRLYFDEECFIRAVEGAGRFRVDNLAPVQGKGVIVGSQGDAGQLADVKLTAAALARRVTFL